MDREQLVEMLTEDDIILLLEHFDAEPKREGNDIVALTICHETENPKRKLYYYPNNRIFYCYTHCKSIGNVVDFTMRALNSDFSKAFLYLLNFFGIESDYEKVEFEKADSSFIKRDSYEDIEYKPIDKSVLNSFKANMYHESWLEEGISPITMNKFHILFDVGRYFTVIPHYDMDGNLIGIRRRAYLEEDIILGKYKPIFHNNILYNHSLGGNLYGLNIQKPNIDECKTLIIFEGEKSVLQLDSYMDGEGIGVATCGSNFTIQQQMTIIRMILRGEIYEVVIAVDKEYEKHGTKQEQFYAQKVRQTYCEPLLNYCKVSVIWDRENLLGYKDSPTDKGKKIFYHLYKNRIEIKEEY